MSKPRLDFDDLEFLQEQVKWWADIHCTRRENVYDRERSRYIVPKPSHVCDLTGLLHLYFDDPKTERLVKLIPDITHKLTRPAPLKFGPISATLRRCDSGSFCYAWGPARPHYVVTADEVYVDRVDDEVNVGEGFFLIKFHGKVNGPFFIDDLEGGRVQFD